MQKVGKKCLCEHNPIQTLQLRGVLKSPDVISSSKLFCTSQPVFRFQASSLNVLPLPQPQAPCSHWREKNSPWNQTQGRPPLAPKWWTNCFGHPAWAFKPLNIPGLKYRGFFFWLFYLKANLEMQAVHSCQRGALLRKEYVKHSVYFGKNCEKGLWQKANLFRVWVYLSKKLKGRRPSLNSSAVQTMVAIAWSLKSLSKRREQLAYWNVYTGWRRDRRVSLISFLQSKPKKLCLWWVVFLTCFGRWQV